MARRRVGERLRIEARKRRREWVREMRRELLIAVTGFAVILVVFVTLMIVIGSRDGAIFLAGTFLGMLAMAVTFALTYLDPIGARIQHGLDGEQLTADELRKLRRHGWRAVHNLHLQAGDIDHVAVGPGGVVVIETKSSNAEWDFLKRQGVVDRWARQAAESAFRTRHLVKQHAGVDIEPMAYLVGWIPRQPDEPGRLGNGVVRIKGRQLRQHLRALPTVLDPDVVTRIASELDKVAGQLDARAGIGRRRAGLRARAK